jgi:hypothetical protein
VIACHKQFSSGDHPRTTTNGRLTGAERRRSGLRHIDGERRTAGTVARFFLMSIDPMTGVIAVSLVVALLCHLWPPPPDDHNGPGETAP